MNEQVRSAEVGPAMMKDSGDTEHVITPLADALLRK